MARKYNDHEVAKILVEADFATDAVVCGKWEIAPRTLYNYRRKLEVNPDLAVQYQKMKRMFADTWVEDAAAALKAGSLRLKDMFKHASTEKDAAVIKAIAEACKTLGELSITYNALNVIEEFDQIGPETVEAKYTDVTATAK